LKRAAKAHRNTPQHKQHNTATDLDAGSRGTPQHTATRRKKLQQTLMRAAEALAPVTMEL